LPPVPPPAPPPFPPQPPLLPCTYSKCTAFASRQQALAYCANQYAQCHLSGYDRLASTRRQLHEATPRAPRRLHSFVTVPGRCIDYGYSYIDSFAMCQSAILESNPGYSVYSATSAQMNLLFEHSTGWIGTCARNTDISSDYSEQGYWTIEQGFGAPAPDFEYFCIDDSGGGGGGGGAANNCGHAPTGIASLSVDGCQLGELEINEGTERHVFFVNDNSYSHAHYLPMTAIEIDGVTYQETDCSNLQTYKDMATTGLSFGGALPVENPAFHPRVAVHVEGLPAGTYFLCTDDVTRRRKLTVTFRMAERLIVHAAADAEVFACECERV